MFAFFWSLASFIIALGILVAVHEWGHFWVARRCGVQVERFSIGFGKALWSRKDKLGTEYVIAAIPLGGYVKMLDERVDQVSEKDLPKAFNRQSVGKRIAIIAAGPVTNFLFAIFALFVMYLIGVDTVRPIIGDVTAESIAEIAQIPPGSEIISVGERTTGDWEAVNLEFISHIGGEKITIGYRAANSSTVQERVLNIGQWQFDPEKDSALLSLGIVPFRPKATTELAFVLENSSAALAGMQVGDKIIAMDGTPVTNWEQIVGYVADHAKQQVEFAVERQGKVLTLASSIGEVERDGHKIGSLGVVAKSEPWPDSYLFTQQYYPFGALQKAADKTWRLMTLSVEMLGKLFTGDVSIKNLSGPISIAQGAGASAGYGLVYFLSFLALISVNLGIINLLPLPVLDGGHLLYYVIELFTGRAVPESVQEIGFRIGGALLLMIMSVAIFNDIARL
jgi:regulator of sigma E protease